VAAAAVGWVAWAAYARTRWATAGAVLHLGLAALTVVRYGPGLVPDGAPGPAADGALRVLTLNSGRDEPAAVALAADLAGHLRPDLVALQETWVRIVDDGDDFRIGGRRAALGFLSDPDYRLAAGSEENLVLLARGGVAVEPDVGGDLDPFGLEGSGGVRRFVAEWGGRPFAVYVVHFRSYSRPGGSPQLRTLRSDLAARAREARYLRDVLDAEALPYLVVGDFNATPDQWTYAHVASGLQDALRETAGWAPTYPDGRPLVQIDAVLTSPGWAVASARVLPPGLSDHRGVLVDLRPPPGGDARE
jgi:endonuclease/exonuclease/phosphatase family metal-dependent hydrolase